jgi:hypothetical protein
LAGRPRAGDDAETPLAWTIGTTQDHAERAPARPGAAWARTAVVLAVLALLVLAGLGGNDWALPAAIALAGARLLAVAARAYADARPPAGGPCFAVATLREGPAEVVARVLPPERGLLSPLTSTKCSYYDYAVEVLDEATGERKVVDEGRKLTDFWLKDVTGSLFVESAGIDIRLPRQLDEDLRTYDQTPRAVGERLRKLGIDPFVAPGVRRAILFHETRLDPGDNVLVKGEVVRREDGRLVIRKGAGGLSVERWTRPTFVPVVPASAKRNLWLGAILCAWALGLALL